ncbi:MAG: diacylglycerol kinase, diacylglycerol kinase [Candidatus Gottesmanbacteria bacterium GW2011_GWA2_43_14]|uniref:Diacylglycerol kinase, diacylglycerol kinase n=1 Tax=Candidatus Gottesmanbacteria bacterium GW2011_GWA2_43_14 TaxID=1618443 RepID=A0A0G1DL35_9BACT|nr:MAG: diacylglycerol kinase, diacylglycerol kinase [Candidatus Gottesmanbacteria bacterium GW2011_GWA2_43_14]
MRRLRQHHISLKNALNGLSWAFTTQPNFSVHLTLSSIALLMAWLFRIELTEMLVIIMVIVFGLGAEMINTSIEAMTDLITKEWKQEAKIAKDVAAGMMLLYAIGALMVGIFIFLPHLIKFIG